MKFDFYITGTIGVAFDWWTGQRGTTAAQVRHFLDDHKDKEVTIAVSSPGGYLSDGIEICEMIKAHGKCNMVVMGMTASAATVLCMKAKSVKIAKGSMMLIHNSSYALDVWTTANKNDIDKIIDSFKKYRDDLDTFDKAIAECYSSRNGKTLDENLAQMDKEKWMLAQDAVDFGIVDGILDDEESTQNAKAIKNVYLTQKGLAQHFGLPELPEAEKIEKPQRGFRDILKGVINSLTGVMNNTEEEPAAGASEEGKEPKIQTQTNTNNMKKIILNLICGLLAVQDLELNEEGKAHLTEEQLNKIENDMKAKADRITALEADLAKAQGETKTATDAKTAAETALADLQKEFNDFKEQAGDFSPSRPVSNTKKEPVTAKEMLAEIASLV